MESPTEENEEFCWKLEEKMIKEKETHIKDLEQMVKNSTIFYEKYLQVGSNQLMLIIEAHNFIHLGLLSRYMRIQNLCCVKRWLLVQLIQTLKLKRKKLNLAP